MCISEALQLRVKDIDFAHRAIVIREAKGFKDRVVMLPNTLTDLLREQLAHARSVWSGDNVIARPGVFLPHALEKKYPNAGKTLAWFWVFPQAHVSVDPRTGVERRHHLYDQTFQREFNRALCCRADCQARHATHATPFLRNQSAAIRLRHSDGAGIARPFERQYNYDLYPRAKRGRPRRDQPTGSAVII